MRSEAEIRSEVETRLRRRLMLFLHGALWVVGAAIVYRVTRFSSFGSLTGMVMLLLLAWTGMLGLHVLRVGYVELRERLVRGAIERERQFYLLRDNYEKRKRSEERGRSEEHEREESTVVHLSDDGELVDAPDERKVKAGYER